MKENKFKNILKLDCDDIENKKLLRKYFYSIKYVKENLEDYNSKKQVKEICDYIIGKMKFGYSAIFYQKGYLTSNIIDLKNDKFFTVYGRSLKELDIKIATFSYYYRHDLEGQ